MPARGHVLLTPYPIGMSSTVLDHFSHVFGDRRGLPKALCERRRIEDLHASGSLIEILTGGSKLVPGESLLIAGERNGQSYLRNQILADLIDQGESCLLVSSTGTEASTVSKRVANLTTSQDIGVDDLGIFVPGDREQVLTSLLDELGAYPVVCVDTLDALVSRIGGPFSPTLSSLLGESGERNTSLIVVKNTDPMMPWRQQLQEAGIGITDHVGAVTSRSAGVLSWDRGRIQSQSDITPLYVDMQAGAVSTWRP